jgi:hypothetical protein
MLAASGLALALALAAVGAARSSGQYSKVAQGAVRSVDAPAQHPDMQPETVALHERDAIAGVAPNHSLPQQVLAARGRAKFQPHAQSVLRLVRERQDAIILAFSHRMRDASEPGAASHSADRPRIVTRPLRGPPALA